MANDLVGSGKRKKRQPQAITPPTEEEKEQINKNFKTLAKMFHPDLVGAEAGEEIMKILGKAKENLLNMSPSDFPPHIGVILDNSGSMDWQRYDVIRAYNAFINHQKTYPDANSTFCLTTFRKKGKIVSLQKADYLDENSYYCSGGTPLHDTIAKVVHLLEEKGKVNVAIVIFTDGADNSWGEYRRPEKIKALIERKIAEGWQFIFCTSADVKTGLRIGIKPECITNFISFNEIMIEFSNKLLQYRKGEVKQITFGG